MALIGFSVLFSVMLAGARALQSASPVYWSAGGSGMAPAAATQTASQEETRAAILGANPTNGETPTPDEQRTLPSMRTKPDVYTVQRGDTLNEIAQQFGVSADLIVRANNIADPNLLEVGQVLTIPVATPADEGPDYKIIPDSELVNGPTAAAFQVGEFVQSQGGFLARYSEDLYGVPLMGTQIIERVAQDYSIHPRLLLALLEYQSGWVTQSNPQRTPIAYPMGLADPKRQGLYMQLTWTANTLNAGYYRWRVNGLSTWLLADGTVVPIAPTINAGTAGVQYFFSNLYDHANWRYAATEGGLAATYQALFGYPFDYAVEPLLPADLAQPQFLLPFAQGEAWSFTGGPHGGWGSGSAWAALDFAPPGEALGCVQSNAWVTTISEGLILRSGGGAVVQDMDGDGNEGTGWVILYMHIETRDRVAAGTYLQAGEPVGHPSCEGGVSNGTHVHIARKYNGEWIAADQGQLPFNMSGWTSTGSGYEYNGFLEKDGQSLEAYAGRADSNSIQR